MIAVDVLFVLHYVYSFHSNCCLFFKIYNSFYEELEKNGLLQPLLCRVEGLKEYSLDRRHFIATKGMTSVVEHYLSKSGICGLVATY